MIASNLDASTLLCFEEFIRLYMDNSPSTDDIKELLTLKLEEKNIFESHNNNLITQDEVCSFIVGHLYTEFVLHKPHVRDVDKEKIEVYLQKIKCLLFDKGNNMDIQTY